jgi:hypothetical protein
MKRKLIVGVLGTIVVLCLIGILLAPDTEDSSTSGTEVAAIEPTSPPTVVPTATMPPTETPEPTINPRCQPASSKQMEFIREGIKSVQESNDVKDGWAVRSQDFKRVWMVAAEITGPGIADKAAIGVWAINGTPEDPGVIMAVDGSAKEFTPYPDASKTDAHITISDDGVSQAKECVETS